MNFYRSIFILIMLFFSLILQSCNDDLKVRPFKVLEIQNMETVTIYFFVVAGNLATVIDIAPTIPMDEVKAPKMHPGESILFETSDIDGYHVDESLTFFVYVEETIEGDGITKEVITYEFQREFTAVYIRENAGKIVIRMPDYTTHD